MQTLYTKLSVYFPILASFHGNIEKQIHFLDFLFKKYRVKNVLDVACGTGRHVISLAKLGYQITGIDVSPYQISNAKLEAKKEKIKATFLLKDANTFRSSKKYDAAICMWSTLGEEPMQYKRVIANVYGSLHKDGIFIIDNRSWQHIPNSGKETTNFKQLFKRKFLEVKLNDRYTEHFRIRESITLVGSKKFEDICITNILKTKDWIEELKTVGFKKFYIFHDFYLVKKFSRPKHIQIVAKK